MAAAPLPAKIGHKSEKAAFAYLPMPSGCTPLSQVRVAQSLMPLLSFASDKNQKVAEIFLPSSKQSILLKQVPGNGAGEWRGPTHKLTQWKGIYMLDTAKGKPLYQGPAAL